MRSWAARAASKRPMLLGKTWGMSSHACTSTRSWEPSRSESSRRISAVPTWTWMGGVPPVGPYVHIEGKTNRYRRCELVNADWKVTSTTRPEQPLTGFTVSAEVAPHYVDMLCKTYEATDDEGRRLTRILAELSINKAEGVPNSGRVKLIFQT